MVSFKHSQNPFPISYNLRPYSVALPSYLTNPHEAISDDIIGSSTGYRIDTATASETLRYLQPGMHTRRLHYGNRMFIEAHKRT